MMQAKNVKKLINLNGKKKIPFFFMVDFELKNGIFLNLPCKNNNILFKFNNQNYISKNKISYKLDKYPINYHIYLKSFNKVLSNLLYGNSFLTNLAFTTEIKLNLSLEEIYKYSNSKYKIYYKDNFVCFSPETFIKIDENYNIHSYPIKGTIQSDLKNSKEILLNDNKEIQEHYTIVDLIRNDLNKVAKKVKVNKFREIEKIINNNGNLWQTRSHIVGKLNNNCYDYLGDIIWELLPAGSISGSPKLSTLKIIKSSEINNRNFYTGIAGFFNGKTLDTTILIRFIEMINNKYYFKSGGGITINSNPLKEYQEIINKIYLTF